MRGSPLIRTIVVLLALLAAAFGIRKIAVDPVSAPVQPPAPVAGAASSAPFFLTFSAPPSEVILESAGEILKLRPEGTTAHGSIKLSDDHPTLFVSILWDAGDDSVPRFAKLTLEPPGQATKTRTFDGLGAIDDVWELHLHP
ncbi:hypothetical protein [Haloferula sp. A504]|uniref:hypothetical protein n=1 Tax=Haloferula sp. A504 TaxID=3373601 RepID=UPI0031C9E4E9|nr:hypothetical protein [Verrucomicrobiaceae bacterium E54]